MSGGAPLQMVHRHFQQFGNDYAAAFLNSIPEPTNIAFAFTSFLCLVRRRRS